MALLTTDKDLLTVQRVAVLDNKTGPDQP